MSPQRDASALAANIIRVAGDSELGDRIAANAYTRIQTFQWDQSITRFEEIAQRLGCSSRTVNRKMSVIRAVCSAVLEVRDLKDSQSDPPPRPKNDS